MILESRRCSVCGYSECSNELMWACPKCSPLEKTMNEPEEPEKQPELNAAVKYDAGKPDMTLVTYAMLEDATKVLMFGEKKYARFNYRKQSPNFERKLVAASMRHITKFTGGEEIDEESGLPHLAHALATLMMIFDRRDFFKGKEEENK